MGGLTLLGCALERPERVRRLVLVGTGSRGTSTTPRAGPS
jgi:pimeloyl-ACP methyl ester carboxylesterase